MWNLHYATVCSLSSCISAELAVILVTEIGEKNKSNQTMHNVVASAFQGYVTVTVGAETLGVCLFFPLWCSVGVCVGAS